MKQMVQSHGVDSFDSGLNESALDPTGFVHKHAEWSREVAKKLADLNYIGPLTEDHWRIIEFVREYYLEHGEGPAVVKVHQATGLSLKKICDLFPCGYVRGAFRVAGLPRPVGCI